MKQRSNATREAQRQRMMAGADCDGGWDQAAWEAEQEASEARQRANQAAASVELRRQWEAWQAEQNAQES